MDFASLDIDDQGTVSIYVTVAPETPDPSRPPRSRLWTRFGATDWVMMRKAYWGMLACPANFPEAIFDALRA